MKLQVVHTSGKSTELEVLKSVFGEKPNTSLLAQALRVYQLNQRQGTAKVKTRSGVARTKKKWYKQRNRWSRHGARTQVFLSVEVLHISSRHNRLVFKTYHSAEADGTGFCLKFSSKVYDCFDDIEKLPAKQKVL